MFLNPHDNEANIDPQYIAALGDLPERQKKRFLAGQYTADIENALWTPELIERSRVSWDRIPDRQRIVIAVDPSGCKGQDDVQADQIGIVVAGLGSDKHGYIFEDATGWYSPEGWAQVVKTLYYKHGADRVVAEKNFGGDMVRAVIHGADPNISYKEVNASRGRVVRAEPISAFYERGQVHHVGEFPDLEDELCNFSSVGYTGMGSPNRADALVWALSELMQSGDELGLLGYWRLCQAAGGQEEYLKQFLAQREQRERQSLIAPTRPTPINQPTAPAQGQPDCCPMCGSQYAQRLFGRSGYRCSPCGHQWGWSLMPKLPGMNRHEILRRFGR